jgi:hypothetical protein
MNRMLEHAFVVIIIIGVSLLFSAMLYPMVVLEDGCTVRQHAEAARSLDSGSGPFYYGPGQIIGAVPAIVVMLLLYFIIGRCTRR